MALIKIADLEAKLQRNLTSEEQNAFNLTNAALQSYVESMIGSSLETAQETTRYYDGGVQHLTIDPCTSITALKYVDDDVNTDYTFDTTDYTTEPINKTLKTMIRYRVGKFRTGINNIAVTAKFSIAGDADMSNIVKDAMLGMLQSEVTATDNIKKESIEGYSVEFVTTETKDTMSKLKGLFSVIL